MLIIISIIFTTERQKKLTLNPLLLKDGVGVVVKIWPSSPRRNSAFPDPTDGVRPLARKQEP